MALRKGPNAGGAWRSVAWDSDEAYFDIPQTPTPDAPDAGILRLFAPDNGTGIGIIDSTGSVFRLMITQSDSDDLSDIARLLKRQNKLLAAINVQLGTMGQEFIDPDGPEVEDEDDI